MSGCDCAGGARAQIGYLPTRAGRCRVLDGPGRNIDAGVAGIEQFNEVVLQRRAAVAATTVNLADDHA